ncbi:class F sortase [Streptomyces sp. Tu 2975]|uniref:class F sortase n=1 Tax=Streptomyces sp. Tu 2975 TaxID=2676871 RepID=UPI00135CEE5C|nr:class F sortase [Streptomyces sp. Tu 2975]QIP82983.1 class F sortase [Streptomyces sp. Tu 2975]
MSHTHRRTRWARPLASAAAIGCLGLAGCSAAPADPVDSAGTTATAPDPRATPRPTGSTPSPASAIPVEPARVTIASVGVDSALMRLGLNEDGTVQVPPAEKGMTAGWYTGAAVPGEPGPAVIIGHNDTRYGKAVFHDLAKVTKGADIAVRDAAGETAHFTVTAKETVRKNAFPTDKVYGATDDRALRLITCSGRFDSEGHPVDNLIVYAVLR